MCRRPFKHVKKMEGNVCVVKDWKKTRNGAPLWHLSILKPAHIKKKQ